MTPTTVLYIQFYFSLASFALIAWWYVVPALRGRNFAEAITPILLLHSFRHFGLLYLTTTAIPSPPPAGFTAPTAYGDVLTALLAFAALAAVRRVPRLAVPAVWVFNVVGFVDLGIATVNASRFDLVSYSIGVAYMLPIFVVPALIVTHGLAFWLLLRRAR
ncbi:MAG TPA: hypothetical protein VH877_04790 [Polyangia bacterium]|jgi:hypothetical protein|nr:hypothetical protein [Polyangia bacterium]